MWYQSSATTTRTCCWWTEERSKIVECRVVTEGRQRMAANRRAPTKPGRRAGIRQISQSGRKPRRPWLRVTDAPTAGPGGKSSTDVSNINKDYRRTFERPTTSWFQRKAGALPSFLCSPILLEHGAMSIAHRYCLIWRTHICIFAQVRRRVPAYIRWPEIPRSESALDQGNQG